MQVVIDEEEMKNLIANVIQSARSAGCAQMQEDVSVGMLWKYLDENKVSGDSTEGEETTVSDGSACETVEDGTPTSCGN